MNKDFKFNLNKESVTMQIVKYVVLGLYILVCVALIFLATIQTKETQGASGTITGSSTNNFFEKIKEEQKKEN